MPDVTDSAQLDAPGPVASLDSARLLAWARSLAARDERCAFDGLRPGRAYGLVCSCSRCSPRCGGAP